MMTLPDETGRERLVRWDLKLPLHPDGRPFRVRTGGVEYFYFTYLTPLPLVRVRADWRAIQSPESYAAGWASAWAP